MNNSKIMSIVIATIAAALVMSSIHSASHVFAKKDGTSSSGGGSDSGSSGTVVAVVGLVVAVVAVVVGLVVAADLVHPRVIMIISKNVFPMPRQVVLRQNSK